MENKRNVKENWSNKAQLSAVDISTALEAFHKLPEVLEPMARTTVSADNVKHLFENTIAQIKDEIYPRVSDYRMRELSTHWDMYKTDMVLIYGQYIKQLLIGHHTLRVED